MYHKVIIQVFQESSGLVCASCVVFPAKLKCSHIGGVPGKLRSPVRTRAVDLQVSFSSFEDNLLFREKKILYLQNSYTIWKKGSHIVKVKIIVKPQEKFSPKAIIYLNVSELTKFRLSPLIPSLLVSPMYLQLQPALDPKSRQICTVNPKHHCFFLCLHGDLRFISP